MKLISSQMFLGCFQDVKERDANIGAFLELSPLSQIFFLQSGQDSNLYCHPFVYTVSCVTIRPLTVLEKVCGVGPLPLQPKSFAQKGLLELLSVSYSLELLTTSLDVYPRRGSGTRTHNLVLPKHVI